MNIIVGLGKTGLSCLAYFVNRERPCMVCDSRLSPPGLEEAQKKHPDIEIQLGTFDPALFCSAKTLVVNPGVSLQEPAIVAAKAQGVEVIGDIELFAREFTGKIVGITGSNGKSTVTTLVGKMAQKSGRRARMGGNIGVPALSLLEDPNCELAILELSSFQLELTQHLPLEVATILNITPDHLDRHRTLEQYIAAKQRIYHHAKHIVYNREDKDTFPKVLENEEGDSEGALSSFGADIHPTGYGLGEDWPRVYLLRGHKIFCDEINVKMRGAHNKQNVLAALAIGDLLGLEQSSMLEVVTTFAGLPHRMEAVAGTTNVVCWFNDSKATNIGACMAALRGLAPSSEHKTIHLILGGRDKATDFTPLKSVIKTFVKTLYLIGENAHFLAKIFEGDAPICLSENLENAVKFADANVEPFDNVLLSPGCTSFDQYKNFAERGEHFKQLVFEHASNLRGEGE